MTANHAPNHLNQRTLNERGILVAEIAVVVLLAIAYEELATGFGDALLTRGATLLSWIEFVIFFFTSLRFAVGNFLHLACSRTNWAMWVLDFVLIALQSLMFILLAAAISMASVPGPHHRLSFVVLLLLVLALDLFWQSCQFVAGRIWDFTRRSIVWEWAAINGAFLGIAGVVSSNWIDVALPIQLTILAVFSIVAFGIDMWAINRHGYVDFMFSGDSGDGEGSSNRASGAVVGPAASSSAKLASGAAGPSKSPASKKPLSVPRAKAPAKPIPSNRGTKPTKDRPTKSDDGEKSQ